MQGNLVLAKLNQDHEGYTLSLFENDSQKKLFTINGNSSSNTGQVVLLDLDPHIVYGMSHPDVINRILINGPQSVLATKELAHKLYEHGMKSSWYKIRQKKNVFLTSLETFYRVSSRDALGTAEVINSSDKKCALLFKHSDKNYLISNRWFKFDCDVKVDRHIILEDVEDYLYLDA